MDTAFPSSGNSLSTVRTTTTSSLEDRRLLLLTVGLGCAAISALVMLGWQLQDRQLIQFVVSSSPMRFNTAVGFLGLGISLLCLSRELRFCGLGFAALTSLLGFTTLLEHISGASFGIDQLLMSDFIASGSQMPGRMASSTALCLSLSGAAILAIWWLPPKMTLGAVLAILVTAQSLAVLVFYAVGLDATHRPQTYTGMAIHTAALFALISCSIILAKRSASRVRDLNWLPLAAGAAGLVFTFVFWYGTRVQESAGVERLVNIDATILRDRTLQSFEDLSAAYQRMANRWKFRNDMPEAQWKADAANYLEDIKGTTHIELLDRDGSVLWGVTDPAGKSAPGFLPGEFSRMTSSNGRIRLFLRQTPGTETQFYLVTPLEGPGGVARYIGAEFQAHEYLRPVLHPSLGQTKLALHVENASNGSPVYVENDSVDAALAPASQDITFDDIHWRLTVAATPELVAAIRTTLPSALLIGGLILSALLALSLRFMLLAQKQREANQRLLEILDKTPDFVGTADVHGRLHYHNRAGLAMVGLPLEVDIGKLQIKDMHPDWANRLLLEVGIPDAISRGVWQGESALLSRDGDEIPVSQVVIAHYDLHGRPEYLSTVMRDMRQHKQQQAQLEIARAEAERANRAKSEFLANMSHEIRTPMNGILGMTVLALESDLTPRQREYVQLAHDSARSLLHLLNDILDFSKIEAGKFELSLIDFDLQERLETVIQSFAAAAGKNGLELMLRIGPDVPRGLNGDPDRLAQVLNNLIGNAIKFTPKGEVLLEAELVSSELPSVLMKFSVIDSGIGISEEAQKHIFDAFTQADSSTTRRFGGTGLGLSISRQIVNLMKGTIGVTSTLNHGSRFEFTARFGITDRPVTSGHGEVSPLANQRALIVDSNAKSQQILSELLARWHFESEACADSRTALARLGAEAGGRHPFTLVLVDCQMQSVDGLDLVRLVHETGYSPKPAIFVLSSLGFDENRDLISQGLVKAYLRKPIRQSALFDAINGAFSNTVADVSAGDAKSDEPPAPKRALHILLAEDNAINQKFATAVLNRRGHQVVIANNGREAVEYCGREAFDVILMDVQMPEMNGAEATAAIREMEKRTGRHAKVIALTADAISGTREALLRAGMDDYLSKPFVPDDLLARVEQLESKEVGSEQREGKTETSSVCFDLESALRRAANDMALLRQMAAAFIEAAPGMLAAIVAAVKAEDLDMVCRSSHTLKGVVANFSGIACMKVAEGVEAAGAARNLSDAAALMPKLEHELDRLLTALLTLNGTQP